MAASNTCFTQNSLGQSKTPIDSDHGIYRKPKQLTDARESVDSPIDERSLQIVLVHSDRVVPAAGRVRSRKPCPSPSTQPAAAQIPEASSPQ